MMHVVMCLTRLQRKFLFVACFIIVVIHIIRYKNPRISYDIYYYMLPGKNIQCFHIKTDTLDDIVDVHPSKGRSIFFLETSCNSHFKGKITVNARQACAVESAARLNPNFDVHLIFASSGTIKFEGTESDKFLQAILSYENVKISHVDYERYTKGSPVEELYAKGKIDKSWYPREHASDVLRFLTLWKYGGIYLDLDVVVVKSLEYLPLNYAGVEYATSVNSAILSFGPEGLGHELAQRCLNDLSQNFKGNIWNNNGPGVITRLLKDICGVDLARDMVNKTCQGFKVFSEEAFYAISGDDWQLFFDEDASDRVIKNLKNSYVVHLWNDISFHTKVYVKGNSAYAVLARKFCPKVAEQCDHVL